jgi:hypothetical protein
MSPSLYESYLCLIVLSLYCQINKAEPSLEQNHVSYTGTRHMSHVSYSHISLLSSKQSGAFACPRSVHWSLLTCSLSLLTCSRSLLTSSVSRLGVQPTVTYTKRSLRSPSPDSGQSREDGGGAGAGAGAGAGGGEGEFLGEGGRGDLNARYSQFSNSCEASAEEEEEGESYETHPEDPEEQILQNTTLRFQIPESSVSGNSGNWSVPFVTNAKRSLRPMIQNPCQVCYL